MDLIWTVFVYILSILLKPFSIKNKRTCLYTFIKVHTKPKKTTTRTLSLYASVDPAETFEMVESTAPLH